MEADKIRTLGRVFNRRSVNESFRLNPFLMTGPCVNDNFHPECLCDFCDFTANVADAYDANTLAFNFFRGKIFELLSRIKILLYHELMQSAHIQIRRCFQQGFEGHVRGGTTVKTGGIHQRRNTAGSVSAAPRGTAHISGSGSDSDSSGMKHRFFRKKSRRGNECVILPLIGLGKNFFGTAQIRLIEKMDFSGFQIGVICNRADMKDTAFFFNVRLHFTEIRVSI